MITVKVTYGVKKEYVQTNLKMIARFLEDFKALDTHNFVYTIYQQEDEQIFVHLSQFRDEKIQQQVLQVPSFVEFQKLRDENLSSAHHVDILKPVGATSEIL